MFNHMGVDLPTHSLSRIQENGKRFYLTPDGGKYPSITTVLGWFSKKWGIIELLRFRPRTACPASSNCLVSTDPKKPVAPVTTIIYEKIPLSFQK